MSESNSITNPAIVVRNVTKDYEVRDALTASMFGRRGRRRRTKVQALKGISFTVREGESLGLLGQNGSGKSTAMRIMAGGDQQTSGDVRVKSEPVLMGISAAIQRHLTGAKNIRLSCLAMGMTPEETDEKFDEIVEFSGLGDSIWRPMRTYSSGMGSRLTFALATITHPEILLIDEGLSAGDSSFNERANERMKEMLDDSGTVVMVSHSADQIEALCSRAIWLHEGEIIRDGDATITSQTYAEWARRVARGDLAFAEELVEENREAYQAPNLVLTDGFQIHPS